jgi:hypothetical protein
LTGLYLAVRQLKFATVARQFINVEMVIQGHKIDNMANVSKSKSVVALAVVYMKEVADPLDALDFRLFHIKSSSMAMIYFLSKLQKNSP